MFSKQNLTYLIMALIIIWAFGYMAYGEESLPSPKDIALQQRARLLAEQSQIDRDNLKILSYCNEYASGAKADEKQKAQYDCYRTQRIPDIDIPAIESNSWTLDNRAKTVVPSWSYQCSIGVWSHDVRQYAKFHPWIAAWKNNNTSWITMGSTALQNEFDRQGIQWEKGTLRPANEWNRYYSFPDLENGMRAKLLIIKRSYKDSTISQFLARWWTDSIPTTLDKNRKIGSLSDSELLSFLRLQIQKESGKAFADYVYNNVIICK